MIFFLICVALGTGMGLFYGWILDPVDVVDTSPDTLRIDYKADYVLMVAEILSNEHDVDLAIQRLALLGGENYVAIVRETIVFAVSYGYTPEDLAHMQGLLHALESAMPIVGNENQGES